VFIGRNCKFNIDRICLYDSRKEAALSIKGYQVADRAFFLAAQTGNRSPDNSPVKIDLRLSDSGSGRINCRI